MKEKRIVLMDLDGHYSVPKTLVHSDSFVHRYMLLQDTDSRSRYRDSNFLILTKSRSKNRYNIGAESWFTVLGII